jgi:hypothetical protein
MRDKAWRFSPGLKGRPLREVALPLSYSAVRMLYVAIRSLEKRQPPCLIWRAPQVVRAITSFENWWFLIILGGVFQCY